MISPFLSVFKDPICKNVIPPEESAFTFPYPLDAFQKEGIYRIYRNENILVTAHTGSGKTVFALYAIAECLRKNKRAIYTSPIKSLSNQKYAEFIQTFGGSVGIMTGDIKMNPDAQCIIMTTEILRNLLFKKGSLEESTPSGSTLRLADVGAVIFDEVHYINDPDRGKIWEEAIVLLPSCINLVMLSATIHKAEQFASWIGEIKQKPICLLPTTHRVVPLRHFFWKSFKTVDKDGKEQIRWEMVELLDNLGNFKNFDLVKRGHIPQDANKLMDKLIDFLVEEDFVPALFFKLSRKKCESLCYTVRRILLTHEEIHEVEKTFDFYMKNYKKIYETLPQYIDVYEQLKKGVVYHHSGLIPILKEIIEILYSKGLVKVLFATETFAIGVNMPTKTVLFTELEKMTKEGKRPLRTDEYLQMSGRAGRRGIDTFGNVILLPTFALSDETTLRNMMTGKSPQLQSKFYLTYSFVLQRIRDDMDVDSFLMRTLTASENDVHIRSLAKRRAEIQDEMTSLPPLPTGAMDKMRRYNELQKRISDPFFTIKKKEKDKIEKEMRSLEPDAHELARNKLREEIAKIDVQIDFYKNSLTREIKKMEALLEEEGYLSGGLTQKGEIALSISECQELLFTEAIRELEKLSFPEIVGVISSFLQESNGTKEESVDSISDLPSTLPASMKRVLENLRDKSAHFIRMEEAHSLSLKSDYSLCYDFVEHSYLWAMGGQMDFSVDGNFVKAILRINNICENLMEIGKRIGLYDLCTKLEGYNGILIRDITTINSLYIDSF